MKFRNIILLVLLLLACVVPLAAQDTECEEGFRLFDHEDLAVDPLCIPENPQRIIAIDAYALESMLALDVKPIASANVGPFMVRYPELSELVDGVVDVGNPVNLEMVLELQPDLIVAIEPWVEEEYDQYLKIAPTVSIQFDDISATEVLSVVGAAINSEATSDDAISILENRVETLAEIIEENERQGTISVVLFWSDRLLAYNIDNEFGTLPAVGLTSLPAQNEAIGDEWRIEVSKEKLDLLDTDYIVLVTFANNAEEETENEEMVAQLEADPLWQTLSAVQNEQVFVVGSQWITDTVVSHHKVLDDLFRNVANVEPQEVSPNPFLTDDTSFEATENEVSETDATAYPITLTHSMGTIEIPVQPENVVALGIADIATVYALGITPVAISASPYSPDGQWPWLDGLFDPEQTDLIPYGEPSFENIVALEPDLILGNIYTIADLYPSLSEIAPTLAPATTSIADSWQEQTIFIGRALGLASEAQAQVQETESQIVAVQDTYPATVGKTFSLSYLHTTDALGSIYSQDDFSVQFFQELGFVLTPALAELSEQQGGIQATLSLETLNLIEADFVVLAFGSPDVQAAYEANPLFQQLPAVQEGRMVVVDLNIVTQLRSPNVLGIRWALDQLRPALDSLTES